MQKKNIFMEYFLDILKLQFQRLNTKLQTPFIMEKIDLI